MIDLRKKSNEFKCGCIKESQTQTQFPIIIEIRRKKAMRFKLDDVFNQRYGDVDVSIFVFGLNKVM